MAGQLVNLRGLQGRSQVGASDLVQDSDGKLRRNLLSVRIEKPAAQPTALTKYTPQTTDALGVKLALAYLKVEGISPRSSADR
ncbi:MAG: hypothetical protein HC936_15835, partial [Leptolyngbyaceae cyanobacterium SU_3_3]|nr:hypothetical protein [Leptolyngbyaceae cyanobacterium SU_3_3]